MPQILFRHWYEKLPRYLKVGDTVDGRNPANQLVDSLSHYLQGFLSQVVQDFFNQQYHLITSVFSEFLDALKW